MDRVLVVFFLGYVSAKVTQNKNENEGERLVSELLKSKFQRPDYHLINNITLPTKTGTTQIDHVLLSRKGIFVIETKHYNGWIFGDENSKKWTQTFKTGTKFSFQNPLHQNKLHINECIKTLGEFPDHFFRAVVVFTGNGLLKNESMKRVIYLTELESYIREYSLDVISQDNVFKAIGKLEVYRKERSEKTDRELVEYLNKKHNNWGNNQDWSEKNGQFKLIQNKYTLLVCFLLFLLAINLFKKTTNSTLETTTNASTKLKTRYNKAPINIMQPKIQHSQYTDPTEELRHLTKEYIVDPTQSLTNKMIVEPYTQLKQEQLADMQQKTAKQLNAISQTSVVNKNRQYASITICDESGKNCRTQEYVLNK